MARVGKNQKRKNVNKHPQPPVQPATKSVETRDVSQESYDLADSISSLIDHCDMLDKALSGYRTLTSALHSHQNVLPEGVRRVGLPLFEYKTPAVRRGPSTVHTQVIDLKLIDPQHIPHVLVPLINYYITEIQQVFAEVQGDVQQLAPALAAIVKAAN